jgi:hypothetical protein
MEATGSSERSVDFQRIICYIPEVGNLQIIYNLNSLGKELGNLSYVYKFLSVHLHKHKLNNTKQTDK